MSVAFWLWLLGGLILIVAPVFWSVSKGAERQMEYHNEMKERWNK